MDTLMMRMLFVLSCIVLSSTVFLSQPLNEMRVVGKAEYQSSELIDKEVRDANSEVCAGLIIATDLEGLKFTSYNGLVKLNADNPGRYFLFLSPDERVVEVYKIGYEPLKIILSDYGIFKMQSGKVWQIKVTGNAKVEQADKELFEVAFTFNTKNVFVGYNNFAPNSIKDTIAAFKLPKGNYTFHFSKDGFNELSKQLILDTNTSEQVAMQPNAAVRRGPTLSATINITSEPTGAEILLNGQQIGITPYQDIISEGEYMLDLRKPMYKPDVSTFSVISGEQKQITRPMIPRFGYLAVSVDQLNSSVIFDNKPIGLAPIIKLRIESGHHTIKITSSLYHDYSEEFDLKDGEIKTVTAALKPAFGSLKITSQPEDGAMVFLDGEQKGLTPLKLNKVASGKYVVKISKNFYSETEEEVVIADGQLTDKAMKLVPNFGELFVSAQGGKIFINNKYEATNSFTCRLIPGDYNIRVERGEQYYTEEKKITLAVSEKKSLTFEAQGKYGEVYVFVTPQEASNAEIFIDDEKKGNAPRPIALLMGNYSLTAKKDGFLDYSQQLSVKENDKQKLTLEMITYEGSLQAKRDRWGLYKWISGGVSVVAGAAILFFNSKENSYYDGYQNATTPDEAVSKRNGVNSSITYKKISTGITITAGVGFIISWIVQSSY